MATRITKTVKNTKFMRRFPRLSIGTLVITMYCTFLIIIATFTPVPQIVLTLPQNAFAHPIAFFSQMHFSLESLNKITRIFYYIPQIPIALMIPAIIGPGLGLFSVISYIAAGISGIPIFAGGGGVDYYSQLGFGYILGFIPGVYTAGNILSGKEKPFLYFRAAFVGVTFIHLVGILYLIMVLLFKHESIFAIFGWIWQLSGIQFFHDLIFGVFAIFTGRFLRKVFWVAMD